MNFKHTSLQGIRLLQLFYSTARIYSTNVFSTLTYYGMFKREGIGKGQKVPVINVFYQVVEPQKIRSTVLPGQELGFVAYGLHVVGVPVQSWGCRVVNHKRR